MNAVPCWVMPKPSESAQKAVNLNRKAVKKMEQRLIDANALREDWLGNGENEYVYDTNSFLSSLDDAPTIDPESLPIVRQLREELGRVTAERDAAQRLLAEHTGVVGMEKVTTCFGCPLDKVLELVLAYRDGRIIMRQEK